MNSASETMGVFGGSGMLDNSELLSMLMSQPPVPYTDISAKLAMPVGAIGPTRARCLDKLRRTPTVAALIRSERDTQGRR